ncbi:dTDP-4-dehydrorhamnose 3,5-epimerase family protein [bacterium]|nr:dTDP-4-dehydrorhamnose 3,5-epimerase family protein [bacterium]
MIDGVFVKELKVIPDERGRLMEIIRCDEECFRKFGQLYMTTTYPGVVKAWHLHYNQDDYITVVSGMIKLAMFDARKDSSTYGEVNELFAGDNNPILVRIPRGVYHGWKGIGTREAIIINCPTQPYNHQQPDEQRMDPFENDIPYKWDLKHG